MATKVVYRNNNRGNIKDPLEQLVANIKRVALDSIKEYANEIAVEMNSCYIKAIDWFYADYTPHSYHRTHSLYKAANTYGIDTGECAHEDEVFHEIDKGRGWRITMIIDPIYIEGNPYGVDGRYNNRTRWVFHRAYNEIIHGFTGSENTAWEYNPENGSHHLNRFHRPSEWEVQTQVPKSNNERSFTHKLAGTNRTTSKNNLDWMVKESITALKKKIRKSNRYDEIFGVNMQKAGLYR